MKLKDIKNKKEEIKVEKIPTAKRVRKSPFDGVRFVNLDQAIAEFEKSVLGSEKVNDPEEQEWHAARKKFILWLSRMEKRERFRAYVRDISLIFIGIGISTIAFLLGAYITVIIRK